MQKRFRQVDRNAQRGYHRLEYTCTKKRQIHRHHDEISLPVSTPFAPDKQLKRKKERYQQAQNINRFHFRTIGQKECLLHLVKSIVIKIGSELTHFLRSDFTLGIFKAPYKITSYILHNSEIQQNYLKCFKRDELLSDNGIRKTRENDNVAEKSHDETSCILIPCS